MFESVLVLDRTHASRLARAELATLVVGAHVAALFAILAAQSWRIDVVPFPSLPAPPAEIALPVVFVDEPPPASRPQPARAQAPRTVEQPAPAPAAATPDQLAAADVPALSTAPTAAAGTGVDGASVAGDAGERPTISGGGDGAPIHYEGSGLTRPAILVRVDPIYPPVARIQHKNGIVILRAEIATDGSVRGAEVVEAAPNGYGFEQSALDAVRRWRFRPATTADGRPVAVLYRLQVTFTVR